MSFGLVSRRGLQCFNWQATKTSKVLKYDSRTSESHLTVSWSYRCPQRRLFASKKSTSLPPVQYPRRTPIPSPAAYLPNNVLFAQTLASKASPTLLYHASSSNVYALTCYTTAGFLFAYSFYHFQDAVLTPHPGLWWVIPYLMGGVCLSMVGAGMYVATGTRRLVKSITALPFKAGSEGGPPLLIRLEARRILPWGTGTVMEVEPQRLSLASRVVLENVDTDTNFKASRLNTFQTRAAVEARRVQERAYDLDHAATIPFRHMGRGLNKVLLSFRRILGREGFVKLFVDDKKAWRIDAKMGWALDDGLGAYSSSVSASCF